MDVNLVRWGNGSKYVDGPSNWVWSGNQGLLLSGLTALNSAHPSTEKSDLIHRLYASAMANLFDTNSILHEAPFERNFCVDPLDYATGKGVLLRFLPLATISTVDSEKITSTATAAFAALEKDTFCWSDDATTLDFQNSFRKMWGMKLLTSTMKWQASPAMGGTYQMDGDMCILDAQVAAVRCDPSHQQWTRS